jgi:hypothetical protein
MYDVTHSDLVRHRLVIKNFGDYHTGQKVQLQAGCTCGIVKDVYVSEKFHYPNNNG